MVDVDQNELPDLEQNASAKPTENPWVEGLKTIALSAILAFGIRTFVAEARYIPSGSMLPTLQVNDRLIVDKVGYYFREPQRGDIVVFSPTDKLREQNYKDAFIKRVIGLPGETVAVRDGIVYINDRPLQEDYINEPPSYDYPETVIPEGHYLVLGDNRNNSYDSLNYGPVNEHDVLGISGFIVWPLGERWGGIAPLHPEESP